MSDKSDQLFLSFVISVISDEKLVQKCHNNFCYSWNICNEPFDTWLFDTIRMLYPKEKSFLNKFFKINPNIVSVFYGCFVFNTTVNFNSMIWFRGPRFFKTSFRHAKTQRIDWLKQVHKSSLQILNEKVSWLLCISVKHIILC